MELGKLPLPSSVVGFVEMVPLPSSASPEPPLTLVGVGEVPAEVAAEVEVPAEVASEVEVPAEVAAEVAVELKALAALLAVVLVEVAALSQTKAAGEVDR